MCPRWHCPLWRASFIIRSALRRKCSTFLTSPRSLKNSSYSACFSAVLSNSSLRQSLTGMGDLPLCARFSKFKQMPGAPGNDVPAAHQKAAPRSFESRTAAIGQAALGFSAKINLYKLNPPSVFRVFSILQWYNQKMIGTGGLI